jgi:hypothetical protein
MSLKEFVASAKADSDSRSQCVDAGLKARSTRQCGDAALKGGSTWRMPS